MLVCTWLLPLSRKPCCALLVSIVQHPRVMKPQGTRPPALLGLLRCLPMGFSHYVSFPGSGHCWVTLSKRTFPHILGLGIPIWTLERWGQVRSCRFLCPGARLDREFKGAEADWMEPGQLEHTVVWGGCLSASPPGSRESRPHPAGRGRGTCGSGAGGVPSCLQVPPGVRACASPSLQPCAAVHGSQVLVCASSWAATPPRVCTHTCAHLQLAGHTSGSPPLVCLLVCSRLGSSCGGGRGSLSSHIQATPLSCCFQLILK